MTEVLDDWRVFFLLWLKDERPLIHHNFSKYVDEDQEKSLLENLDSWPLPEAASILERRLYSRYRL